MERGPPIDTAAYVSPPDTPATEGDKRRRRPRGLSGALATILILTAPTDYDAAAAGVAFGDVAPVLASRCIVCHSGSGAALGLRLDTLENLRKGSSRGPVVVAGDPAGSELIRRIKGDSQPRMPMTGPPYLSGEEIALLETWVKEGLAATGGNVEPLTRPAPPPVAGPVNYGHVAPIFATRCVKCHRDGGVMGAAPEGYVLNSYQATMSAVDRVRVVSGNPAASELLRRIRGQARPRMPLDGPPYLGDAEIALIEDWITRGARNSEGQAAAPPIGAKVRLHGSLRPGWLLDDLSLRITPRTRTDKSPAPGDYVQVRGRLGARGEVEVDRLRRR